MNPVNGDSQAPLNEEESFPPLSGAAQGHTPTDLTERLGSRIGPYELVALLGEGGFGMVYLAEQQHPIKRQVALKVIKPGMDTRQVIARFEAERQTLALLDHPNIAHVFDAGATETGRPYFVMELVEGLSIVEYCDRHKLNIENRLELFLQVCEAIQYAHQKGIIHRDLKPSNVLVGMQGDKAMPKVIDFGVAKAIAQPLSARTLFTEQGQLIGTPGYMSPEQTDISQQDIDVRTDVYSLGVLLYELLSGTLPFDADTFRQAAFDQVLRIIREEEPLRPSSRLSSLGEDARKIAEDRQTEVTTLANSLREELEWIPLKAIRKERDRRYESASELARDILNYLDGRPLLAGPDSVRYRLRKLMRKRVRLVALSASASLSLILVLLIPYVWMRQLNHKVLLDTNRSKAEAILFRSHFQPRLYGAVGLPELNEQGAAREPNQPGIVWVRLQREQDKNDFSKLSSAQKRLLAALISGGTRDEAIVLSRVNGVLWSDYVHVFRATDQCMSCHSPRGIAAAFTLKENVGVAIVQARGIEGELRWMAFMSCIWTIMAGLIGAYGAIVMFYLILSVSEGWPNSRR